MRKVCVTGTSGSVVMSITNYLKDDRNFVVENLSLRDDSWKNINFDYDVIIHVVGVVPGKEKNKSDFYAINTELTIDLANKARNDGVKQFIFLSSMSVYGFVPQIKGDRWVSNDTPLEPKDDYGFSKMKAEHAIIPLNSDRFSVAVIRVPSIYYKGNIDFLNIAVEMINRFKCVPMAYENNVRNCIYVDNLSELMRLIIINEGKGVFCAQDEPVCSLCDYMELIADHMYSKKHYKKSRIIGLIVKLIVFVKESWQIIYGGIAFDDKTTLAFEGKYRIYATKDILPQCIDDKDIN